MKILAILVLVLAFAGAAQAVCNDCVLQAKPVQNSICRGESATYDITIANAFDQPKAITLYAAGDIPLMSDIPSQVVLQPYETKTLKVSFTPTSYTLGEHRISLKASGFGSEDTDDAVFYISDCYAADLQLSQPSVALCQDGVARLDYVLKNTGQRQDTYAPSVSGLPEGVDVSFEDSSISLAPGASKAGSITIRSSSPDFGVYIAQLNMLSQSENFYAPFAVNLTNCYQASVRAPLEFVSCPDAGLAYTATIKNNGCVADTYALSASGCKASLSADSLALESGESRDITIVVDDSAGKCNLTVSAASKYDSDSATTAVDIKKCYGVDVAILPASQVSACRGETVDYSIKVTNTGFYADLFRVAVAGMPAELSKEYVGLESGESDTSDFSVHGTWCATRDIPFSVSASGKSYDSESGLLMFLPAGEECAALDLAPSQTPLQVDCSGELYTFYVKNTGFTNQEVTLAAEEPQGLLVQPARMTLKPYETRPASVYIEPLAGRGNATVIISAESQYKKAYLELNADFTGPVCIVSRPSIELPGIPVLPAGNLAETPANETAQEQFYTPAGAAASGVPTPALIAAGLALTAVVLLALILLASRKRGSGGGHLFPEAGKPAPAKQSETERLMAIKQAISEASR